MSYDNNAKVKGLDITLDNPARFTQTYSEEWLNVNAWFFKVMNYVLDRSNFKRYSQSVKTISKPDNISENKYLNNMKTK